MSHSVVLGETARGRTVGLADPEEVEVRPVEHEDGAFAVAHVGLSTLSSLLSFSLSRDSLSRDTLSERRRKCVFWMLKRMW